MKAKFPKIIAVTLENENNPEESFFVVHKQPADAANMGSKIEVAIYERKEVGIVATQEHYTKKTN